MHNAWMDTYPNDYIMLDLGISLWMLADAIEATSERRLVGASQNNHLAAKVAVER